MIKATQPTKASDIKRSWHLIDVKDQILGRQAVEIAHKLMGKGKSYFANNMDCGDYVVVLNAKAVRTTGKKELLKKYTNYSGYPGGLRTRTLKEVRQQDPTEVITHAVRGMLPKNKLRDQMLKRLYVFVDENNKYADKFSKAE
jgi:large subunit ribosomal protein L13